MSEKVSSNTSPSYISNEGNYILNHPYKVFFLNLFVKKLNNNSSSSPDGVSTQCIKCGGDYILDTLEDIYNLMREKGYSPLKFRQAWIAPAWKGQDRLKVVNY